MMSSLRSTVVMACLALCACGPATSNSDGGGPTTVKSGYIQLMQSAGTVSGATSVAMAGFSTVTGSGGGAPDHCTTQTSGACTTVRCDQSDAGTRPDSGVTVTNELAGTITIDGTRADGGITLVRGVGDLNAYTVFTSSDRLWAAGDRLTASATGDTVPAFSGKSVTAPADLTVTAPVCPSSRCGTVPRTAALTVSWSGATAGTSVAVSVSSSAPGTARGVTCTFDGSAGSGTVPAALMAELVAGSGSIWVMPVSRTSFKAGDYDVTLSAVGNQAQGIATFQ